MRPTSLEQMSEEEIKQAVKDKYSQVASTPGAKFHFPVGRNFAESVGYPREILDALPPSMSNSFTGAGNPQPYVDPEPGETVLDLGCGAGLDLYFYSRAVGDAGTVYGLDISEAMVDKARKNLQAVGIRSVEMFSAPADAIPLPDGCIDLVTANGIYNLSPDKDAVMREVYRVLKPSGRTVFAEIVLKAPLPREVRKNIDDWFRCIGGSLPEADFLSHLRAAGFHDARMLWRGRNARTGHKLAICAVIRAEKYAGRISEPNDVNAEAPSASFRQGQADAAMGSIGAGGPNVKQDYPVRSQSAEDGHPPCFGGYSPFRGAVSQDQD